jgi:hypothetical protein
MILYFFPGVTRNSRRNREVLVACEHDFSIFIDKLVSCGEYRMASITLSSVERIPILNLNCNKMACLVLEAIVLLSTSS